MRSKADLRKYQKKGVRHIVNVPRCALFLDMGLGKTATALTGFTTLVDMLMASKALIIAPKRVAESVWSDEVKEWEHLAHLRVVPIRGTSQERIKKLKLPFDVHTISFDNAQWLLQHKGNFNCYDMIIVDESSMLKNSDTKRFKILSKFLSPPKAGQRRVNQRIVLLTGTPTPNSLLELWPQVFLLDGGERLYPSVTRFRNVYSMPNPNGYGYEIREGFDKHILALIDDICLSMRAKDYGFEVPQVTNIIKVKLPEKLQNDYKNFAKESIIEFIATFGDEEGNVEITAMNAAVLHGKLTQFCNGAIYDREHNVIPIHDEKIHALESIFNEVKSPILVAYSFDFDKDRILALCKKMGKRAEVFKKTEQIYKWNRRELDVLIMHPKSGGHGLNLQKGGHTIVWFGSTSSLEAELQLNARLARTGQNETVVIHKILTLGTVEEKIMKRTDVKKAVQEAVMEYFKLL